MKLDLKKIPLKLLSLCTLAGIMVVGLKGCKHESLPSQTVGNIPHLPLLREVIRVAKIQKDARGDSRIPQPYVPPEATVTITPKDPSKKLEDLITVKVKTYGLCFKPGIQVAFPLGVGLDAKLAFYGKYGVGVAGILGHGTGSSIQRLDAAVFGSRHFERFDNLESVVGLKFNVTGIKSPYVALRLSF